MAMTADGQPQRIRRRRRKAIEESDADPATPTAGLDGTSDLAEEAAEFRHMEEEAKRFEKLNRECPIPKPGGVIGSILGFDNDQARSGKGPSATSSGRNEEL